MMTVLLAPLVLAATTFQNGPDVTIRTKTTSADGQVLATAVLRVKDGRQRLEGPHGIVHITQCDTRRSFILNSEKRLYASAPFPEGRPQQAAVGMPVTDTRPIATTMVFDAVDTGERRRFGPLTARRVVTTTTAQHSGDAAPARIRVQDGWYVDLPGQACGDERGVVTGFVISGPSAGRVDIKWKGTARTGWPVIEKERIEQSDRAFVVSTVLEEVSEAPLDAALFEVPAGYRPALPLGHGAVDLERPDTPVNRARHAWENAASWVHYTWRTFIGGFARHTAQ